MANHRTLAFGYGDWVKITLRPGQSLSMFAGHNHEEGFTCQAETYTLEDDIVRAELTTWGRDCDGRHESRDDSWCHVVDLRDTYPDEYAPHYRPTWNRGAFSQRDYTAEAAGY